MRKTPHVALLIETSRGFGRGLLQGITHYLREHRAWSLYFEPHDVGAALPGWLKNWRGDGILARIDDRHMGRALARTGIPTVDLRSFVRDAGFPGVGVDNPAVIRLALQHLQDCGFRHFAFCGGLPGQRYHWWMDYRADLFEGLIRAAGTSCHRFAGAVQRRSAGWESEQAQLAAWIHSLPKPVGVLGVRPRISRHSPFGLSKISFGPSDSSF
jgi:LacI family transcriptional regulator